MRQLLPLANPAFTVQSAGMPALIPAGIRAATLLAINLLFLMVWGFASLSKLRDGIPPWFGEKFGSTFFAHVPGLAATFWTLAASELIVFVVAGIALLRLEFLGKRTPT